MNCYFYLKKDTDSLIEQTKTKPQASRGFKMKKQMQTFSFNPPIKSTEEGKWLLGMTLFECTITVLNITNTNNSFSITIPGHWQTESAEETIDELNKLLELRTQKGIELHVRGVRERGNQIKIGSNEYNLSDFDTKKKRDTRRIEK